MKLRLPRFEDVQAWFNGEKLNSDGVRQHYKLALLIAGLVFLYILAGYNSLKQQRHLLELKKEVRDAKYEYLTIFAKRTEITRQSYIVFKLTEHNSPLKENQVAPIKID